ncbi:hypothetical protein DYB28_001401 [Aphanomyces astaci]|uniref:Dolichol kinase n=1 Tax=Aphanomyces astaci TaxID=112090 RepID=A0A3L6UQQ8_APHAT|nr:hypothetical protein DYB34_007038 [Aphanomyces astaci]RLN96685.1 hypothetical protein DYB28_001401 [Aphanomyces astaci]
MEQLSQGAYVLAPLAVRWKLLIPDLTERCVYVSMLLDQLGTMSPVGLVQILSNFIDLSVVSAGRKNVLVLLFTVSATPVSPVSQTFAPEQSRRRDTGGVMCALIAMVIVTNVLGMTMSTVSVTKILVITTAVTVDLFESLIKRAANVKDSSRLIHGHAGLLGRVDTLLFASILFALYNIHAQLLD